MVLNTELRIWNRNSQHKKSDTMITMTLNIMMYATGCILLYTWLGFPSWILLQDRRRNRHKSSASKSQDNAAQHVSILLSAWNEADVIEQRILNIKNLAYPDTHISIYIGTDGCTDETADIVRAYCQQGATNITLCAFENNRGKASVLRDLMARAMADHPEGTLLVFTDANTIFKPDALTKLTQHFHDPAVGGVCGRLRFERQEDQPEHTYWAWETHLKVAESNLDSCLGANGAIYAIRASCFWLDLPTQTIIDDFVIGMKVREAGLRMRFEPDAIAYEDLPAMQAEWQRRVRIGSGAFQALAWCRACLHPRYGWFALFFWSHKVLRWFTPHLAMLLFASACGILWLQRQVQPTTALVPAAIVAGFVAIGCLTATYKWIPAQDAAAWYRYWGKVHHFVMMQAALFAGFIRFCRGNLSGSWQRTPRTSDRERTHA